MKRRTIALASIAVAAALAVVGFFLIRDDTNSVSPEVGRPSADDPRASASNKETRLQPGSTARLPLKPPSSIEASADAETAYELVELNQRCQIDREAGSGHIPLASEGLCKDLSVEPLSREEIFKAITYAAENGSVKAQLHYAVYASRMFEDEKYAFDIDLIQEYKENTVRFLEAAGSSGQPGAYIHLSDIYKNGAIAPEDRVMSYAYAEAFSRTYSSRYGASFLSSAASGLDGAQLRRGRVIANQILEKRTSSK